MRQFTFFAALALASIAAAQPKGWQVFKDKTGACQVAVPADWHPNPGLHMATGPDKNDTVLIQAEPGRTVKPVPEGAQAVLGVEKMIENTAQRVLWAGKPVAYPAIPTPVVTYHLTAAGNGGTCTARITVKQTTAESLVKQIGESVGPAK